MTACRLAFELLRARRESLAPATHLVYRALQPEHAFQQLDLDSLGLRQDEDWHAVALIPTIEGPQLTKATVPAERILGVVRGAPTFARNGVLEVVQPSAFLPNPLFVPAVHAVIKRALLALKSSDEFQHQAELHDGGWFLIRDPRAPTAPRRGPEPEEFFGGVLVKNQLIDADSYTPNPFYKVLSPLFGYTRLPTFLQQEFDSTFPVDELRKLFLSFRETKMKIFVLILVALFSCVHAQEFILCWNAVGCCDLQLDNGCYVDPDRFVTLSVDQYGYFYSFSYGSAPYWNYLFPVGNCSNPTYYYSDYQADKSSDCFALCPYATVSESKCSGLSVPQS